MRRAKDPTACERIVSAMRVLGCVKDGKLVFRVRGMIGAVDQSVCVSVDMAVDLTIGESIYGPAAVACNAVHIQ